MFKYNKLLLPKDLFQDFLTRIKQEKVMLYTFVHNCDFKEEDDKIDIYAESSFCFNSLSEKNNKIIIKCKN